MPPFLPLLSLNRSQSTRIGSGPGNSVPSEFNMGDTPTLPGSGAIPSLFYADLGSPRVRRDLQRHDAVGGVETVGNASLFQTSDLFKKNGLGLTPSGSNMNVAIAAGTLQSRFYGTRLSVAAQTVTLPTAPALGGQTNYVYMSNMGIASVVSGAVDAVAPTYEVWTITSSATGGTFDLQFIYNGFIFTAAGIAYNATNVALLSAIVGATGGPGNTGSTTFGNFTQGTPAVISGGPLPATTAITFQGSVEGAIVPYLDPTNATGGTMTVARTTQGAGGQVAFPSGNGTVLGGYYVPSGTANAAAATAFNAAIVLTQ